MPVVLALIRSNALIKFVNTSANVKTATLERTVTLVSKMMECVSIITFFTNRRDMVVCKAPEIALLAFYNIV